MRRVRSPLALVAVLIAVALTTWWQRSDDPRSRDAVPGEEQAQIAATLALIERGGPFPYRQDGVVFQNREHQLPERPRGYYREYTVPTPGAPNRGARRIVTGADGERWYTRDHYKTFVRIDNDAHATRTD